MAGYIGSTAVVSANGAERKKTYTITGTTTSLTGLSYTVNQVHVFHNGVRLVDGTDFTATNGNSITLTSAAESGDEVVVLSYAGYQVSDTVSASQGGTFSGDVTVSGAFTSQGIDDNASATAMTLDSSGNVLVGQSSTTAVGAGNTTTGFSIRNDGGLYVSRSSGPTITANANADGDIIKLYKSGSTVGSIGIVSAAGDLYISSSDTDHSGLRFSNSCILPYRNGTLSDGTVDLGQTASDYRFKDLYLSGGVYLGGTGSANKLDDYEEGTWTPTAFFGTSNSGTTYNVITAGQYTKTGNTVHITGRLMLSSKGSSTGYYAIASLPFTISQSGGLYITFMRNSTASLYQKFVFLTADPNDTSVYLRFQNSSGGYQSVTNNDINNDFDVIFSGTYKTNA